MWSTQPQASYYSNADSEGTGCVVSLMTQLILEDHTEDVTENNNYHSTGSLLGFLSKLSYILNRPFNNDK